MSEPKAYLIEWVALGQPRVRVQLGTRLEPWLEECAPTITPLYAQPVPKPLPNTKTLPDGKGEQP